MIVAARNEADRIAATLEALGEAFPGARLVVADDGSTDGTARLAAELARRSCAGRPAGARQGRRDDRRARGWRSPGSPAPLPWSSSATATSAPRPARCAALADAVEAGDCDLAVASFARREGGGFGIAVGFARRAIRSLTGLELGRRSRASGRCAVSCSSAAALRARLRDGDRR